MVKGAMTARQAGFLLCRKCRLLSEQRALSNDHHCPRCGAGLGFSKARKPDEDLGLFDHQSDPYFPRQSAAHHDSDLFG